MILAILLFVAALVAGNYLCKGIAVLIVSYLEMKDVARQIRAHEKLIK